MLPVQSALSTKRLIKIWSPQTKRTREIFRKKPMNFKKLYKNSKWQQRKKKMVTKMVKKRILKRLWLWKMLKMHYKNLQRKKQNKIKDRKQKKKKWIWERMFQITVTSTTKYKNNQTVMIRRTYLMRETNWMGLKDQWTTEWIWSM